MILTALLFAAGLAGAADLGPCPRVRQNADGLSFLGDAHGAFFTKRTDSTLGTYYTLNGGGEKILRDAQNRFVVCSGERIVAREFEVGAYALQQPLSYKLFNAHHMVEDAWGKTIAQKGAAYDSTAAPTILLVDSGLTASASGANPGKNGSWHYDITYFRQPGTQAAFPRIDRTYAQERAHVLDDVNQWWASSRFTPKQNYASPEDFMRKAVDPYYCSLYDKNPRLKDVFAGSPCDKGGVKKEASATVQLHEHVQMDGGDVARIDASNVVVKGMKGHRVKEVIVLRHAGKTLYPLSYDAGAPAADSAQISPIYAKYVYRDLRAQGDLDKPFEGWYSVVDQETGATLFQSGPHVIRVDAAAAKPKDTAAASCPIASIVYDAAHGNAHIVFDGPLPDVSGTGYEIAHESSSNCPNKTCAHDGSRRYSGRTVPTGARFFDESFGMPPIEADIALNYSYNGYSASKELCWRHFSVAGPK